MKIQIIKQCDTLIYWAFARKLTNGSGVDNWNREHVWAKSHGNFGTTAGAGTDLHHLRATDVSVNSSRGNLDFDNGGVNHSEATECKYDSDSWEPRDSVKGISLECYFTWLFVTRETAK